MSTYQKILVVVNPFSDIDINDDPAFKRAKFFAKKMEADVVLASCVYDSNFEMTTMISYKERLEMKNALISAQLEKLHSIAANFESDNTLECEVVWHKKLYKGIIQIAEKHKCDLIVKTTKSHSKVAQKLFTPNDWHLLRNSPVNVLMVKNHEWLTNGNIVSAVSIEDDAMHDCLSKQVAAQSREIAQTMGADIHLTNTYIGAPVHISIEMPQFNHENFNKDIKIRRENQMQALLAEYSVNNSKSYVIEGLPEDAVPALCKKLDAELLVLGSVGRKGVSAALLGNTAEHIIDKINCDTLVVKPAIN